MYCNTKADVFLLRREPRNAAGLGSHNGAAPPGFTESIVDGSALCRLARKSTGVLAGSSFGPRCRWIALKMDGTVSSVHRQGRSVGVLDL